MRCDPGFLDALHHFLAVLTELNPLDELEIKAVQGTVITLRDVVLQCTSALSQFLVTSPIQRMNALTLVAPSPATTPPPHLTRALSVSSPRYTHSISLPTQIAVEDSIASDQAALVPYHSTSTPSPKNGISASKSRDVELSQSISSTLEGVLHAMLPKVKAERVVIYLKRFEKDEFYPVSSLSLPAPPLPIFSAMFTKMVHTALAMNISSEYPPQRREMVLEAVVLPQGMTAHSALLFPFSCGATPPPPLPGLAREGLPSPSNPPLRGVLLLINSSSADRKFTVENERAVNSLCAVVGALIHSSVSPSPVCNGVCINPNLPPVDTAYALPRSIYRVRLSVSTNLDQIPLRVGAAVELYPPINKEKLTTPRHHRRKSSLSGPVSPDSPPRKVSAIPCSIPIPPPPRSVEAAQSDKEKEEATRSSMALDLLTTIVGSTVLASDLLPKPNTPRTPSMVVSTSLRGCRQRHRSPHTEPQDISPDGRRIVPDIVSMCTQSLTTPQAMYSLPQLGLGGNCQHSVTTSLDNTLRVVNAGYVNANKRQPRPPHLTSTTDQSLIETTLTVHHHTRRKKSPTQRQHSLMNPQRAVSLLREQYSHLLSLQKPERQQFVADCIGKYSAGKEYR